MKQELFNLGNVLNTSSDLKTAKLNQSRKQLLQDTINMENEAYGNFIAKDNPNAMVQPVDSNKDGTIDAGEQRQATIRTGMKMNALNDVENVRNKRSDRATAAQNRKQIQANRSERMNWARQDRKAKKEDQYKAIQSVTKLMEKNGFSQEEIDVAKTGSLKMVSAISKAGQDKNEQELSTHARKADLGGQMSMGAMEQLGAGKSTDEVTQWWSSIHAGLSPEDQKLVSPTPPTNKDGQVSKDVLGIGLTLSSMAAKAVDYEGLSDNQKRLQRNIEAKREENKAKEQRTAERNRTKEQRTAERNRIKEADKSFQTQIKDDMRLDDNHRMRVLGESNKNFKNGMSKAEAYEKAVSTVTGSQAKPANKSLGASTAKEGQKGTYNGRPVVSKNGKWVYAN